jgi:hypothetical protein
MAVTTVDFDAPSGLSRYKNTDSNATKSGVKASSGAMYSIIIDNTGNAAVTYLKLYDAASGDVTVGTTAPDWIIKVPASTKLEVLFPETIAFGTALTEASVTAGGTAGSTGPTTDVPVTILYT